MPVIFYRSTRKRKTEDFEYVINEKRKTLAFESCDSIASYPYILPESGLPVHSIRSRYCYAHEVCIVVLNYFGINSSVNLSGNQNQDPTA